MNETDILVEAGLSRTTAELVVACHTMASALADIAMQQQQQAPKAPPEDVMEVMPDGDNE